MKVLFNNFALLMCALMLAVVSIGCAGSRAASNKNANAESASAAPQIVDVSVSPAVSRELPEYFEATGSLVSDEQTDVAPAVGGKVTAVNFDVGSYVQKGSVLVRLDDRDARIRLEQAQAQVQQQQAAVRQAEESVRQAAARLGLNPSQRNFKVEDVAEVRNAQATLDLQEKQLQRYERLVESGDVSRTIYDQQRTLRDQARSAYESALNTARQSYAAIATAQAAVSSARAGVSSAQTQVSAANKAIADTIIYAPISGSILERNADPGEFVGTQGKVATIARTNPIRLRIDVPEQSIGQVRVGQSVSLETSSYPDRNFSGTIARIIPGLNATSRTLTAEASIFNSEGLLKPGQFATVRVLQSKSRQALMIPAQAIKNQGTSNSVFVIRENRAEQRVVQIGATENDMVEIINGVKPDEQVAVSSLDQLTDGIQVRQ